MRALVSALCGALFGAGLLISGMTDAERVRGFLRLLGPGAWDPTLAFVMGGAILPMAVTWWLTRSRRPVLAPAWPGRITGLDAPLVAGSVMFGMGWGLVGLCPGPALAALGWGGAPVVVFTSAMAGGMIALPPPATEPRMDLRELSDDHAVSPMIDPSDMIALREAGFVAVICNRPDAEVPPGHQAAAMQEAAEAAGLAFTYNPVTMPGLSMEQVEEQADAMEGRTLAYCASGTRSAILWALSQAGRMPADAILAATARAGYQLDGLRPQIEQLEKQA